ncbi:hypothetical protein B0H10DRAFT_2242615 [Mycena sp. CBHHK59/15]|nr:hypothetical protein B0H10DRAFT_2242615 [Mycena sp. CBHHK59/15]
MAAVIILAYLVTNLTRWTTHFVTFMRLFLLQEALEFAVLQNQPAIIAAQVGTATSTEAACLKEDAERFCALIRDQAFWEGLETVLAKIDKRTKIRADLRAGHARQGLVKSREGRKNHKSTATLLIVPRYRDLLEDQDDGDPTEQGRTLVSSTEGWRTQMATWIADANAAEAAKRAEAVERVAWNAERLVGKPTWMPITLALLFGGAEKPRTRKPSARVIEEEEILMQALADEEEDDQFAPQFALHTAAGDSQRQMPLLKPPSKTPLEAQIKSSCAGDQGGHAYAPRRDCPAGAIV